MRVAGETEIKEIAPGACYRVSDDGEFDPGSERTLAARFKHASRAARTSVPRAADG